LFFGSIIFSLRYTVPISGLWMWFVVFCATSLNNRKKRLSFFPPFFVVKHLTDYQTCLFLTETYLRPLSVLSAVRPFIILRVVVTVAPPRLGRSNVGWPVQRGLSHFEETGGESLAPRRGNEKHSRRLAPSLHLEKTSVRHTRVCRRVRRFSFSVREEGSKHRDGKTGLHCCCLLIITNTHTHTHTHTHTQTHTAVVLSLSVVLLPPINIFSLPPVGGATAASQCFCSYFEYCILFSLQTASSLIILLTIIIKMVSGS